MDGKKSFVAYLEWGNIFSMLSDEEAGKLVKHLFSYVKDENPELNDRLLQVSFEPIKLQLKRDLKKWELLKAERSKAGKISAEKRKQTPTNPTSVECVIQTPTNPTVNVNVNANVDVNKEQTTFFAMEQRKKDFWDKIYVFINKYDEAFLKRFFEYYTTPLTNEPNKMAFESNAFFAIHKYLDWFAKRENKEKQTEVKKEQKPNYLR